MDGSGASASLAKEGRSDAWFATVSRLFVVCAALASVGAVSLHLCGYVAQRSFLRAFSVDPDGFPRSTDWMLVNGYYSVIDIGLSLLKNAIGWTSLGVFVFFAILIAIFRWKPTKTEGPKWLGRLRRSSAFQLWGVSFLFSGLTFLVAYLALPLALIFIMIPAFAGETFGEARARELVELYQKGCSTANPCTEVWVGGSRAASGFVIATSTERLAFYDVDSKVVRLLENSELELRSPIDPRFSGGGKE
jgi:hypothetical protein